MQLTIPLTLIALGGLLLITQRNRWLVLGALLVQWAGFAWQIFALPSGSSLAPVEAVTGVACCGILALTVRNLGLVKDSSQPTAAHAQGSLQSAIMDQVWLWAIALVAGLAGFGLARLYPLGSREQDLTAFYWMILPAMLAIVIDGSRDPLKMGAGVISLANGAILLVYSHSATSPDVIFLGLAAICRVAAAAILGYTLLALKMSYLTFDLNILFDMRDSKIATGTALALISELEMAPQMEVIEPHVEDEDAELTDETYIVDEADDDA
jgi:hypothetical protein